MRTAHVFGAVYARALATIAPIKTALQVVVFFRAPPAAYARQKSNTLGVQMR